MNKYPDVDTDVSGYTAGLAYDEFHTVVFPGVFHGYKYAARRALDIHEALLKSGLAGGASPHVGFTGERPHNFPRNGVRPQLR